MNTNAIAIATTEAKSAIRAEDGLEDRLRAAFGAVFEHWLVTDESDQVIAAVAAVMESYGKASDEYERLRVSLKALAAFSRGDLEGFMAMVEGVDVLPLNALWREVRGQRKREKDPKWPNYQRLKRKFHGA